ncbi:MAG: CidA/LrgA family protein [Pseudomonadota bacterium]
MLGALGTLLGCQLIGEVAARSLGLPVPGPVLGLTLLVVLIAVRPAITDALRLTTTVLLAHLSLMFVPAGVGVIGNLDVLSRDWLALLVVLLVSTWIAMLATVATFLFVRRLTEKDAA